MNEPIIDPLLAAEPEATFESDAQLIPRDSVAGRALVVVIAIMTFLACLTAGAALLVADGSRGWRSEVLRDATIQVKPRSGDDIESLVDKAVSIASHAKGVESAHAYSKAESEKLLEPWLGPGLSLDDLPVPRMIAIRVARGAVVDTATLRQALARDVAGASLDDHRGFIDRMRRMANTAIAGGLGIFGLVLAATILSVAFATRGAMASNRPIVEVLHLVGASDRFIAREFQTHFRRLGLRGSMIGGLAAMAFFAAASFLSFLWAHSPGGDEIAAMFGSFALGPYGYVALALVCAAVTLLTGLLSREIALRHLRTLT